MSLSETRAGIKLGLQQRTKENGPPDNPILGQVEEAQLGAVLLQLAADVLDHGLGRGDCDRVLVMLHALLPMFE